MQVLLFRTINVFYTPFGRSGLGVWGRDVSCFSFGFGFPFSLQKECVLLGHDCEIGQQSHTIISLVHNIMYVYSFTSSLLWDWCIISYHPFLAVSGSGCVGLVHFVSEGLRTVSCFMGRRL